MSDGGIFRDETGAQRTLGYVLDLSAGDGQGRCTLTVDERHTNRTERIHGGLLTVILDSAMGGTASLACGGESHPVVTITLTTNYVSGAGLGDELTAIGTLKGGGRKIKYIDGVVTKADGSIVATATGAFKSLTRPS